jgi:uncharacterized protein
MNILVSGASGLIGSSLVPALTTAGHTVVPLTHKLSRSRPGAIFWDPAAGSIPGFPDSGIDAVIHLAGENIAAGRWTAERKARIRDSRVQGTRLLCATLARMTRPPSVILSASALGYYGDRGDELLTEESSAGRGFLAEVCRSWEEATSPARERGIRVVNVRTGIVLSSKGGMLGSLRPVFRLGLGGTMGDGKHYMSWIAIDDYCGAIQHCLKNPELAGPVIVAAPNPVTNREFAKKLAKVLKRPTVLTMPAAAARLMFGEMAGEMLLASQRAEPVRLKASGYHFLFPSLEPALEHVLSR